MRYGIVAILECNRIAVAFRGKRACMIHGATGYDILLDASFQQVREREFCHFTCTDESSKKRWYYINQSREVIVTNLKALIARDIFGNQAFYPIINKGDKTIQESLNALNQHKAAFPITDE